MVKAPHCAEDAWKLPLSTCRYLVLTVCDRSRLNNATFVPLATQTESKRGSEVYEHSTSNKFFDEK
jgi:hypothetical protein